MSKKIKILYILSGIGNGGVESFLYNYLSNMDRTKYEFDIIVHQEKEGIWKKKLEEIGCNIYMVTNKKKSLLKNIKETYVIMKNGNYDIVHSNITVGNFVPLSIAKFCKIKKRISHSHLAIVDSKENIINKFFKYICKLINRSVANVYMACGDDAGIYLYGRKNYEKGKVIVLNNAIDVQKFQFNYEIKKEKRQELGINEQLLVGHVGRFLEQKNHRFLVSIMEQTLKTNNNIKFLLIGNGELKEEIEKKCIDAGINENVIFLQNRDDVNKLMQAMDIFVLPSLYEGLPVVGIEAQAAGLKCIFSNTITDKVKVLDTCTFLPIDNINCSLLWKKEIENFKTINREGTIDEIRKHGYDIKAEVKKLEKIYLS